jgi:hypothetical protein
MDLPVTVAVFLIYQQILATGQAGDIFLTSAAR